MMDQSNKQRAKSKDQRVKSNEQRAKVTSNEQKVTSNEQKVQPQVFIVVLDNGRANHPKHIFGQLNINSKRNKLKCYIYYQ